MLRIRSVGPKATTHCCYATSGCVVLYVVCCGCRPGMHIFKLLDFNNGFWSVALAAGLMVFVNGHEYAVARKPFSG